MKFQDMPYERVKYEDVEKRYQQLMHEFTEAPDGKACMEVVKKRYELNADMTSMDLCYIHHDMDVDDAFFATEQAYYDEVGPKIADLSNRFDRLMLTSPYRDYLEQIIGHQAFAMMEAAQQGYHSELIELCQEENNLLSRHNNIFSTITVDWNGTKVKASLMTPEIGSKDRGTRKRANLAISDAWEAKRGELEEIYDKLVKNRDEQARKTGYRNFVELSYFRMNRIGYDVNDVSFFREEVKKYLVPFLSELEEKRRKRLGLDKLYSYDSRIYFPEGNPIPLYDTKGCLEATRKMYTEMSPETAEFIEFLMDNELYDVEIRDGKRSGGYMMPLEKYRAPFIMANFDGTTENAYIMCHEGGHAFQTYLKRDEEIREKCWFTSEAAETHAMSMEFFAWPYMELFFGERAKDYRTMHLENALSLIARECQQDEFQQLVYENPSMSRSERNALWARLDGAYFPGRDYDGDVNLVQGCSWQRIQHIFQWPFYAIDYALAQVCALEYLSWMKVDRDAAWQSYLAFCRNTGTEDFKTLTEHAGLGSPFAEGTMEKMVKRLKK
ncbi:MAG: M3 family oligoendopeptidase [Butyrivibrio sp.]